MEAADERLAGRGERVIKCAGQPLLGEPSEQAAVLISLMRWRRIMIRTQKICLTGLLGMMLMAGSALGETMMFKADLKAASEVPPAQGGGEGNAMVTLDTEKRRLHGRPLIVGFPGTRRPLTSMDPQHRAGMPARRSIFREKSRKARHQLPMTRSRICRPASGISISTPQNIRMARFADSSRWRNNNLQKTLRPQGGGNVCLALPFSG